MDFLFGQRKSPKELLRQNQRALDRAVRELDRERTKLEMQEKKLMADIKRSARAGQIPACKVMAKDLVRTRDYVKKFFQMRTQLQAVSLRIQTMQSSQTMADSMRGVTKAMRSMNNRANLPQITKIMADFEKESEIMDMKEEMIGDAIEGAMDDDANEIEEEEILAKVFDEIGIQVGQQFGIAPQASAAAATPEPVTTLSKALLADGGGGGPATDDEDAALLARLEMLKK